MSSATVSTPAALLACALLAGALGLGSAPARAGGVALDSWAYGAPVAPLSLNTGATAAGGSSSLVWGGAFNASISGLPGWGGGSLVTYCVELEEAFELGRSVASGYTVVGGAEYFQRRRGDAGIAARLGALMTWEADHQAARTADSSSAMQLAVWNLVYDPAGDPGLFAGSFMTTGSRWTAVLGRQADSFLAQSQGTPSRYEVFVLERAGSQDFLMLAPLGLRDPSAVPVPATWALVLLGLGAGAAVRRAAASAPRPQAGRRST